jgi:hypothetical protein
LHLRFRERVHERLKAAAIRGHASIIASPLHQAFPSRTASDPEGCERDPQQSAGDYRMRYWQKGTHFCGTFRKCVGPLMPENASPNAP